MTPHKAAMMPDKAAREIKSLPALKIDPTFHGLIPPLTEDEYKGLEESILTLGRCRDTIKVWKDIIVDGHNRYSICQEHNIPYKTQSMRFQSRKDAELWIVQNQLGRRNLINAMRIKLVLHKEGLLKERARQNRNGCQGAPVHTRKIMAKEAGTSEQTLYRYMKVRKLGTPELLQRVESGQVTIGEAFRGLEVTTRVVERLYDADDCSDVSNPYCRAGVIGNIEKLARMYGFVFDNAGLLQYGDDMARVERKLGRQFGVVGGLVSDI